METTGKFLKIVSLLSPPRQDMCFRNFTVATFSVPKRNALVGILWQETQLEVLRAELYYYNVPCASFFDIPNAQNSVDLDGATGSVNEASARGNPWNSSYISVQGNRITSIAPHMGGIHPSSPLRDLPDTQSRVFEDEVGGLQTFCNADQRVDGERHREYCLDQKMMIWGRSKKDDRI